MSIKELDFHGLDLDDAKNTALKVIDEVRLERKEEVYRFITGRGVIQNALLKLMKESDCEAKVALDNPGVIVAEIS